MSESESIFHASRGQVPDQSQEPAFFDGTQAEKRLTDTEVADLQKEVEKLKSGLAEADRLNRKLANRIFIEGSSDQEGQTNAGKAAGQE